MRLNEEKTTTQVLAALEKPTLAQPKEREARRQRVEEESNSRIASTMVPRCYADGAAEPQLPR